jgi:hypothetical protein
MAETMMATTMVATVKGSEMEKRVLFTRPSIALMMVVWDSNGAGAGAGAGVRSLGPGWLLFTFVLFRNQCTGLLIWRGSLVEDLGCDLRPRHCAGREEAC